MNYAIIAAGEGSRLRKEGFKSVKPLVKVCGEYLIERLIRIFKSNNAKNISIIINEESKELETFLNSRNFGVNINLIIKSTPSSLHSFWNILKSSNFKECCLTTVDTIFNENDFRQYILCFQKHKEYDALMGTTKYIDDEKPLFVKTDKQEKIEAYLDNNDNQQADKVSAGIYCLREKSLNIADKCIKENVSRMRNYQRALLENGLDVQSFLFGKVIDIDHVEDIKKAEKLIKHQSKNILAIYRKKEFSPNSEEKDTLILNRIADNLKQEGYNVDSVSEDDFCKKDTNKPYDLVVSMARSEKAIEHLTLLERKGTKVVNSTLAIENCFREKQTKILSQNNIPIPKTIIIDTKDYDLEDFHCFKENYFWIKRGDFQTIEEVDVIRPQALSFIKDILQNYNQRNIKKALICDHIEGDVIKFYGIRNTDFFFYYYPKEDKFHNKINNLKTKTSFNKSLFMEDIKKAIELLDLDIYGGDAVIDSDGRHYIIDINDFPSFASCRQEAAEEVKNIVSFYLDK